MKSSNGPKTKNKMIQLCLLSKESMMAMVKYTTTKLPVQLPTSRPNTSTQVNTFAGKSPRSRKSAYSTSRQRLARYLISHRLIYISATAITKSFLVLVTSYSQQGKACCRVSRLMQRSKSLLITSRSLLETTTSSYNSKTTQSTWLRSQKTLQCCFIRRISWTLASS